MQLSWFTTAIDKWRIGNQLSIIPTSRNSCETINWLMWHHDTGIDQKCWHIRHRSISAHNQYSLRTTAHNCHTDLRVWYLTLLGYHEQIVRTPAHFWTRDLLLIMCWSILDSFALWSNYMVVHTHHLFLLYILLKTQGQSLGNKWRSIATLIYRWFDKARYILLNLRTLDNAQQVVVQDYSHTYTTRFQDRSSTWDSRTLSKQVRSFLVVIVGKLRLRFEFACRINPELCITWRWTMITYVVSQASGLEAFSRYPCRGSFSAVTCRWADDTSHGTQRFLSYWVVLLSVHR